MSEPLRGVGLTAVWVAMLRATESERADRLIDDRFARAFVEAAMPDRSAPWGAWPPGASEFLAIRARYYDDRVLEACAAGVRQVVQLAAGLDTRAFRLSWPDRVRLFELDLPELFAFKEKVLTDREALARCDRVTVGVDLRGEWAQPLCAAGFDPAVPTAWLIEGLLVYLSKEDNDRLLVTVTGLSAPGSHVVLDHMDDSGTDRAAVRQTSDNATKMGAGWQSTMADPVGWLAGYGWHGTISRVPALGIHYGRPLPEMVDLTASNATLLCAATRS